MVQIVLCLCFLASCAVVLGIPYEFDFNVAANEKLHHTGDYKYSNSIAPNDDARMIVRRGQQFSVFLADDEFSLSFNLIPYDAITTKEDPKSTVAVQLVSSIKEHPTQFQVTRVSSSGKTRYDIYVPYKAPVSMFHWVVVNGSTTVPLENELVILFNPWCPSDDVYLSDPKMIGEYILESDGLIWYGSSSSLSPMGWDYAQFHYSVLEVTLYFLSNVKWASRGDIVTVSRALSSWLNVNDNGGLVWGRWSGSYDDGKNPTYWVGSQAIYEQYRDTLAGVKYGQCWVFGGCLTSAGRTLGIPSRTLTNFDSAHESASSGAKKFKMSLDMFFDESGGYESTSGGSVWNFHVWNEFWMKRNDLKNNDGWQAVDSTPQERSDGLMQMGPASVDGIKAVNITLLYDTNFVASEVGAVITKWIKYDTGKQKNPKVAGYWLLEVSQNSVGNRMSTKSVGTTSRNDITRSYKTSSRSGPTMSHIARTSDIQYEIVAPDHVLAGENFTLSVIADCPNCGPTSTSFLEITGLIQMMTYTGDVIAVLKEGSLNVSLKAAHVEQGLTVSVGEYIPYFKENNMIEYHAFVKYWENGVYNGSYALKSGRFDVLFPPLNLTAANLTDTKFTLNVFWKNPLNMPLTKAILRISGSSVYAQDVWVGNIAPGGIVSFNLPEVYHSNEDGEEILVFVKLLSTEIPALNAQLVVTS